MTDPVPNLTDATVRSRRRRMVTDLAIAVILLVTSAVWATAFWNAWTARGGKGGFYQTYFEPAVMIACGKGFVISTVQPKPLEDFLFQRRDSLSCEEIPATTPLGTRYLYQGAWRYLLVTVGLVWRIFGISWSGMGPMLGAAFGVVIALAYGIFRLGMGRVFAVAGAVALAASSTHLLNLPHLRDYAKAPFTLALVLLIGLLVVLPVRKKVVVGLAIACGVVLGIGYGFRTDFLINVPFVLLVLFAFLDGPLTSNLGLKAASAALFVATFAVVSWPITSTVYTSGGCQWHIALLGLQSPYDEALQVRPAPYDFGHAYSDEYMDRTINGYQRRIEPGSPRLVFCGHDYDVQSGRYMQELVTRFPGDFITRSYASVMQMTELPVRSASPPISGWMPRFFEARMHVLARQSWGFGLTVAAVVLAGVVHLRWALFLLVFLAYFGGYPAIQFQERHYFHLEFMGWWAMGFVAHWLWAAFLRRNEEGFDWLAIRRDLARSFACVGIAVLSLVAVLAVARWYQAGQVRDLMRAYLDAPKTAIDHPDLPLPGIAAAAWPQLLAIDVNGGACGEKPALTFRYATTDPALDFSRTITLDRSSRAEGTTRVFQPVFENYAGLQLAEARPGCITRVSRVTDPQPLPLLLGATLPPRWESLPLYQSLILWGRVPNQ